MRRPAPQYVLRNLLALSRVMFWKEICVVAAAADMLRVSAAGTGNGNGYGATGTRAPAPTALPPPLRPGPFEKVALGSHPPFTFPPTKEAPAAAACNAVQHKFPAGTNANTFRADAVRDLYRLSWDQYAKYCFGHDQINVLDNTCEDDIFGWGATIVDGIDTAIVMNLTDIVADQLAFIASVDFRCVSLG